MKRADYIFFIFLIFAGCKKELITPIENIQQENIIVKKGLYVGGIFSEIGGVKVNNIAFYDGTKWDSLGSGLRNKVQIECIAFYKNELYVGGFVDSAGNLRVRNIARWNGKRWDSVGAGVNGRVTSLKVFNDELYVGGWFSSAGELKTDNIAKWNGTSWLRVGEGVNDEIYGLEIHKNDLYACGWFNAYQFPITPANRVAKWNGQQWIGLGKGLTGINYYQNAWVNAIKSHKGKLFATGYFFNADSITPVNCIAHWNDSAWSALSTGIRINPNIDTRGNCLESFNDELYLGGNFRSAGSDSTIRYLAKWNGVEWKSVFPNITDPVLSLAIYNNELLIVQNENLKPKKISSYNGTMLKDFVQINSGFIDELYVHK